MPHTQRVKNVEIRKGMGVVHNINNNIELIKLSWYGHTRRMDSDR